MTALDDTEIVDGLDVDHLDDRPDDLHHVAIEQDADGDLRALPFTDPEHPPGFVEIDVDLIEYDAVCRYVEQRTDFDRRITFTRVPAYTPPNRPTGPHTYR